MFKNILIIPTRTQVSDKAIKYAVKYFPSSKFHIMSVIYSSGGAYVPSNLYYELIENLINETLEHARKILSRYDVELEGNVIEGETPNDILEYIEKKDIDLVVLPIQERDIHFKLRFNRQDEKIIKKANIPILTVNWQAALRKPKRIFNPTDGLMHSFMATEHAILLASQFGARIDMVFISKNRQRYKQATGWAKNEAEKMQIRMNLDRVIGNFHPAEKILGLVQSKKYDLIVMGKGRGLAHGDFLSIVSREVIASAPIPVLVVGG